MYFIELPDYSWFVSDNDNIPKFKLDESSYFYIKDNQVIFDYYWEADEVTVVPINVKVQVAVDEHSILDGLAKSIRQQCEAREIVITKDYFELGNARLTLEELT